MSYINGARERAQARMKSPWMLPLIMLCMSLAVSIGILLGVGVWELHLAYYPSQTIKDFDGSLLPLGMFLPLLFVSIPLGFIFGNLIAWLIPPARKSLNKIGDYSESQKILVKTVIFVSLPAMVVSIIFSII